MDICTRIFENSRINCIFSNFLISKFRFLFLFKQEAFMPKKISLDSAYAPSEDVVARIIEGELILVPLAAGMGDMEDELFTLNETGKAVWNLLDGQKTLKDVVLKLSVEFEAPEGEIERDVLGLVTELCKRRMLVEAPGS